MNDRKLLEIIKTLIRMNLQPTKENILMMVMFHNAAIKGLTHVQLPHTPPSGLLDHGFRIVGNKVSFVTLPDVALNTVGLYFLCLALTNQS